MLRSVLGLSDGQVSAKFEGLPSLLRVDPAKLEPRFQLLLQLTGWSRNKAGMDELPCPELSLSLSALPARCCCFENTLHSTLLLQANQLQALRRAFLINQIYSNTQRRPCSATMMPL